MKVSKVIPDWRFPEASERELSRRLQEATSQAVEKMRDSTARLKFDATDEEIKQQEEDLQLDVIAIFLAVAAILPRIGRSIYQFNSTQWLAIAIASGGEDDQSVSLLRQTGAVGAEPWFAERSKLWETTAQNSVVKLANDIVQDWSGNMRLMAMKDATRKAVDEKASERYPIYGSWSKNRASGIIGSFNAMLMRQRLKDANVSKYIWKGKMDERERPTHVALQNAVRELNGPGIFPGEEYNCRCWAIPYWPSKIGDNDEARTEI